MAAGQAPPSGWAESIRGRVLAGKYRVLRPLAAGGMGAVFEAEHLALARRVAIKIVLPNRASRPQALERFQLEARAAANLGDDGIVQILDLDHDAELGPFQVMELLEGEPLAARIGRGPMSVEESVRVLGELLRVLERVHAHGIVHRDIKPGNVFLERNFDGERVKVLDFGIARVRDPRLNPDPSTLPGVALGTLGFMAPEQVRGEEIDARADLYSVGLLLYACLSGREPFAGLPTTEIVSRTVEGLVPSLAAARLDLPDAVLGAYRRATAAEPATRFQSAREMAAALGVRISASAPAPARATTPSSAQAAIPTIVSGEVVQDHRSKSAGPRTPLPPTATAGVTAAALGATEIVPRTRGHRAPARPRWPWVVLGLGAFIALGGALAIAIAGFGMASNDDSRGPLLGAPILAPEEPPDPSLEPMRAELERAHMLASTRQWDSADALYQRVRDALAGPPPRAGSDRARLLGRAHVGVAKLEIIRMYVVALDTRDRTSCTVAIQPHVNRASDALAMASDPRFFHVHQCVEVAYGDLYQAQAETCRAFLDSETRGSFERMRDAYYAQADRAGPCGAELAEGRARAIRTP
ncbi:MAG: serine/threonine protein kinase [Sandaracinaceae bacterium]|nr:serine/threonine protein kinase [Sandaracinaceae bacterium]